MDIRAIGSVLWLFYFQFFFVYVVFFSYICMIILKRRVMQTFLIQLGSFFKLVFKNWGLFASIAMLVFLFLFVRQCQETNVARQETEETRRIADNNLKALKDSSIVLMVTRSQLALIDINLSKVTRELDSLKKHPKIIAIIRPEYIPTNVITDNMLLRDSTDSTKYGLAFNSFDSVRTIKASSWFNLYQDKGKFEIKPNKSIIHEFSLNFGFAVAKYEDEKNKVTRLAVQPYYVDSLGNYIKPISSNLLAMRFRGAELLDVPYKVEPQNNSPPSKKKYSLRSGFALSCNFVNYGYVPNTNGGYFGFVGPSLSLGYSFVLLRNK